MRGLTIARDFFVCWGHCGHNSRFVQLVPAIFYVVEKLSTRGVPAAGLTPAPAEGD
jgi:hypothetical protein